MNWTWTAETLASALGRPFSISLPQILITSVQHKPDECSPGALFVPLPIALKRQGFEREEEAIAVAIENGASAALTNLWQLPFRPRVPIIHAAPTIAALVKLAQFARSDYRGKVIAVTGSVGKTTTTALVHHMLSHVGLSFKSPGNTIQAVCEGAINRPLKSHFTVMEVGSTRPGHLRHAGIARPHVGVVTNVGLSHLGNYRRAEDILREKVSLFDHLEGERVGIVHRSVLEADDASKGLIRSKTLSRLLTVGKESDNDIHLTEVTFDGTASEGTMSVLGKSYRFRLSLPGRHFVDSAMFAVAVGSALGLDVGPLIASFATARASPHRFERYRIATKEGVIELIDDSYNAAPDSVSALLDTMEHRLARRKVFVFGDMLELGNDSVRFHKAIAPAVKRAGIDLLVTVGELAHLAGSGGAANEFATFANADSASAALPSLIEPWDLVAVKASKAVGLDTATSAIRAMGESTPVVAWKIEDDWHQQAPGLISGATAPAARIGGHALAQGVKAPPDVSAISVFVINADTGQVLYAKNEGEVLRILSLTKLVTASVLVDHMGDRLSETVTIDWPHLTRGSTAGLNRRDVWTLQDLLYGMVLVSGNDASLAIADYVGQDLLAQEKRHGNSMKRFVAEMCTAAKALGAEQAQFADPHGLSPANVATARDIGLIAARIFTDPRLVPAWARTTRTLNIRGPKARTVTLKTSLEVLGEGSVIGAKTGSYVFKNIYNLVTAWRAPNGQTIVGVVLGSKSHSARYDEMRTIMAAVP